MEFDIFLSYQALISMGFHVYEEQLHLHLQVVQFKQ